MERISTIHEVYDKDRHEFVEKARCPFCHRTVEGTPTLTAPFADKHLIRTEHGCGGDIAIFRRLSDEVK